MAPDRDDIPRAPLARFPGVGCRFYLHARCLREEMLNPGLETTRRCSVLASLERSFDDFVDRAERFGLDETEAGRLMERTLPSAAASARACPHFMPAQDDPSLPPASDETGPAEAIPCALLLGDCCLRAMPPCEGVCRHFLRRVT